MRTCPVSLSALAPLALLALASCDDRYLVGFADGAAGMGGGPGGAAGASSGAGGSGGSAVAGNSAGGVGGSGGGVVAGSDGHGGTGVAGSPGGGGSGGSGVAGSTGTGGAPIGGTGVAGSTGAGGSGIGGTGGSGGTGGAIGGTGGGPATVDGCPIAPAPVPLRALAIPTDDAADRLGRLLWGQRADVALLGRAASLRTNADVQLLAREMLKDPRAEESVRALMRRWLRLDVLAARPAQTDLFRAFRRESDLFAIRVMLTEDAFLLTLLTAPFTFVDNQEVASFYGGGNIVSTGVSRITMDVGQRRSGILTHASLLSAHPRATVRGAWLRDVLLCEQIPMPPESSPPPEPSPGPATYRQWLTQSVGSQAACQSCHTLTDPPGFALEHYDVTGRFRATEEGMPIDATGRLVLPSGEGLGFNGARELGEGLSRSCHVHTCVVRKFMQFALGDLRPSDERSRAELNAAFAASGFNLRELLIALTGTTSFLAP